MTIDVRDGAGQVLSVRRNGTEVERVPVTGTAFTHTVRATRAGDEGPLGTFWGAEVLDTTRFPGTEVPTVIANPVFLADRPAPDPARPDFRPTGSLGPVAEEASATSSDSGSGGVPWGPIALAGAVTALVLTGVGVLVRRRRRPS